MATLSKHHVYNKGWHEYSSLKTDWTTLGPEDGTNRYRSVFEINLNSINSN